MMVNFTLKFILAEFQVCKINQREVEGATHPQLAIKYSTLWKVGGLNMPLLESS